MALRYKLVDKTVMALARTWMEDNRGVFPPNDFDALTQALAEDIQSTMEDFVNPDYLEINLKALRLTVRGSRR